MRYAPDYDPRLRLARAGYSRAGPRQGSKGETHFRWFDSFDDAPLGCARDRQDRSAHHRFTMVRLRSPQVYDFGIEF
jgi:hypothetical protein